MVAAKCSAGRRDHPGTPQNGPRPSRALLRLFYQVEIWDAQLLKSYYAPARGHPMLAMLRCNCGNFTIAGTTNLFPGGGGVATSLEMLTAAEKRGRHSGTALQGRARNPRT